MSFLEKRQYLTDCISRYHNAAERNFTKVNEIEQQIKQVTTNIERSYSRGGRLRFLKRSRNEYQEQALRYVQALATCQNNLIKLYEETFVVGKKYYFF